MTFNTTSKRAPLGAGGFTLIELLIVITIISALSAIAIPAFTSYKLRAYRAELDSDAKNIYTAAQAYLSDNPSATVDSPAKLASGGYQRSGGILIDSTSMTQSGGFVEIHSITLKAQAMDNNSVIFSNGRILSANSP